jgi:hypothetical protein
MSNQQPTSSDEERPWTIRNMDPVARTAAAKAANRSRKTVGEWLSEAIRFYLAHESKPLTGEVVGAERPSSSIYEVDGFSYTPPSIEEVRQVLEVAVRVAELSGEKAPPKAFMSRVQRLLASRVTPNKPVPARSSPPARPASRQLPHNEAAPGPAMEQAATSTDSPNYYCG